MIAHAGVGVTRRRWKTPASRSLATLIEYPRRAMVAIPSIMQEATLKRGSPRSWARLPANVPKSRTRSEEHTSELQSQSNLVCRLLLGNKILERAVKRSPRRPAVATPALLGIVAALALLRLSRCYTLPLHLERDKVFEPQRLRQPILPL